MDAEANLFQALSPVPTIPPFEGLACGMSGELMLQSAPGEGSTFCLRLPRVAEA